jgi:hypothetical protein
MHPETKTIFATSLSLSIEKFVFLGFFIDNFLPSADSLDGVCVCVRVSEAQVSVLNCQFFWFNWFRGFFCLRSQVLWHSVVAKWKGLT